MSWYNDMRRALAQIGMPMDMHSDDRLDLMRLAGFGDASVDETEIGLINPETIKIDDDRQRLVVNQYQFILDESRGLEAMCTALFSRHLGMSLHNIKAYCEEVRQEAFHSQTKVHHTVYVSYIRTHVTITYYELVVSGWQDDRHLHCNRQWGPLMDNLDEALASMKNKMYLQTCLHHMRIRRQYSAQPNAWSRAHGYAF